MDIIFGDRKDLKEGFYTETVSKIEVSNYPPFNGAYYRNNTYFTYTRVDTQNPGDPTPTFWFDNLSAYYGDFGWRLEYSFPEANFSIDLVNTKGLSYDYIPFNNWYIYNNWAIGNLSQQENIIIKPTEFLNLIGQEENLILKNQVFLNKSNLSTQINFNK